MSLRDWVLLVILSVLWGGSFLFNEIALTGLPAPAIVFGRTAGATLCLLLWLRLRAVPLPPRAAWGALAVMGLLNNAVPFTLFTAAQGSIDASLASILNATTPLWTVLVAHAATTDERLTPAKVAGLVLGLCGVVLIQGWGGAGEGWAILACLGAAGSYGVASNFGRRFRVMGLNPEQTALGQLAFGSLFLLPLFLLSGPWALPAPGLSPVLAVIGLATLCSALAYLIFFRILASAGSTRLSLVTFLIPASAMAMGAVFLGERVSGVELAGLGLILLGLLAIDGRLIRAASARSSR